MTALSALWLTVLWLHTTRISSVCRYQFKFHQFIVVLSALISQQLTPGDQSLQGILPDIMQAVTCFQCGRGTMIAPNAYTCPNCGADLQHLLLPEIVASYFQARAHESSERGELGAALAEAERGLTYADSSELHLLAAILAKQLGRHDRMRQHVAAIPVDDTLRSEAEWLLRSHQDRERALQEAARHTQLPLPPPLTPDPDPSYSFLDELLGGTTPDTGTNKRTYGQSVASVAIVVVAVIMVAASWWWIGPGTLPANRAGEATDNQLSSVEDESAGVDQPTSLSTAPSAALPAATLSAVVPTSTSVLMPTATPTPAVPENLVQTAAETPELADSNPNHVIMVEATIFDIRQYLRDEGFVELAELAIDARLQGETLALQGFVHLDVQRRQLLEIARAIPGVVEVNAVNLLLRPMPTYIVQDGDTLWSIVFNIYGNVDRLDEFAAYNRAVLPSPDALAPGMELRVLPIQ
jgi:nucleoid-associated protein YgaU